MRWALAVTCACRLASAKGSIKNTQLTKLRSRPTEPVSSINNTPTPASCCSNTHKLAHRWCSESAKGSIKKTQLTKLRSSPTEPVSSINNTPTPASCCSNTHKFHFILYLTVWSVEPVVTHQASWLESTGVSWLTEVGSQKFVDRV